MNDNRKKSPAPTSARPTTDVTASVWIGWTANKRLEIKTGLLSPRNTWPDSLANTRHTMQCNITFTKWYPQGCSWWSKKFTLKESTVKGRYDLWEPEWVRAVPQKSLNNRDERGVDQRRSWFSWMARLFRRWWGYIAGDKKTWRERSKTNDHELCVSLSVAFFPFSFTSFLFFPWVHSELYATSFDDHDDGCTKSRDDDAFCT